MGEASSQYEQKWYCSTCWELWEELDWSPYGGREALDDNAWAIGQKTPTLPARCSSVEQSGDEERTLDGLVSADEENESLCENRPGHQPLEQSAAVDTVKDGSVDWGHAMIHVVVNCAMGETLELDIERGTSRLELKALIDDAWRIPCACQKLKLRSEDMEDEQVIRQCYDLALSLDTVSKNLESSDPRVRQHAWRDLGMVGTRGGVVIAGLKSKHLRLQAVQATSEVAKQGDVRAISALSACLIDEDEEVRAQALQALARVGGKSDSNSAPVMSSPHDCVEKHMAR